MSIDWPVLLQGKIPLQLTMTAEVIERAGFLIVARLTRHEFRTRGLHSAYIRAANRLSAIPRLPPVLTAAAGSQGTGIAER